MSYFTIFPVQLSQWSQFAYYKEMFSAEECEKIKALFKDPVDAKTGLGEGELKPEIRSSQNCFFDWSQDTAWIYDRLYKIILACNVARYGFQLSGIFEKIQLTRYVGKGDHYDWHQDNGPEIQSLRKLSVVVQLSDPNEYEGCKLEFAGVKDTVPNSQGDIIVFPSYQAHRVTPLESGERWSLVVWVSGEPYK